MAGTIVFDKNYNISCMEIIENSGYSQLDFTTTYEMLGKSFTESDTKPNSLSTAGGNIICGNIKEYPPEFAEEDIYESAIDVLEHFIPVLDYDINNDEIKISNFSELLRLMEQYGDSNAIENLHFYYIEKTPHIATYTENRNGYSDGTTKQKFDRLYIYRIHKHNCQLYNSANPTELYDIQSQQDTAISESGVIDMNTHKNLITRFGQTKRYKHGISRTSYTEADFTENHLYPFFRYLILGIGVVYIPTTKSNVRYYSQRSMNALKYTFPITSSAIPTVIQSYIL